MKKRYFEAIAIMVDLEDRRFDKSGMGSTYSSLIHATSKADAEAQLRKEKRFRHHCIRQGLDWHDVDVVVDRVSVEEFSSDLRSNTSPSMRRDRFLKRVSA